ncbi:MAG: ArgE/DapE family deacylase, partial [Brevibacterium aurantiacum]
MITNDAQQRILAAVDAQFDEQLAATAELVNSPSRREHEEPAQNLIESHLHRLGLNIDRWAIDSPELRAHPGFGPSTVDYAGMTNVVGTYQPTRDVGKSLILNGHIDVVPQGPEEKWSRSPWDAEVA